jgi:hypothetical protein
VYDIAAGNEIHRTGFISCQLVTLVDKRFLFRVFGVFRGKNCFLPVQNKQRHKMAMGIVYNNRHGTNVCLKP